MSPFFSFSLGTFLSVTLFVASNATADEVTISAGSVINASAYCDFLNDAAVTDTNHLYDEAMGSDSHTACIMRFGKPGGFSSRLKHFSS